MWRCAIRECTFFIYNGQSHIIEGRESICNGCGEKMVMDEKRMKMEFPLCPVCNGERSNPHDPRIQNEINALPAQDRFRLSNFIAEGKTEEQALNIIKMGRSDYTPPVRTEDPPEIRNMMDSLTSTERDKLADLIIAKIDKKTALISIINERNEGFRQDPIDPNAI